MTIVELREEALALPAPERAELAEALWLSLESEGVPEWHKELLDARLAETGAGEATE